jgi:PleD family two-component response regulator
MCYIGPVPDKLKVLVVDDDVTQVNLLYLILTKAGYSVVRASSCNEALDAMRSDPPDMVISDVEMPGGDGFQLATMMSMDLVLRSIPIILTSGRRISPEDHIAGLAAGCDDYILKPFQAKQLMAHVQAVLRRREIGLDANPLTRLPGNTSILRRLERIIASQEPFAALYIDLNNFKGYNDRYGFLRGDDVLKFTGQVLLKANHAFSEGRDFVGHVGGDDFVVVTNPDRMWPMSESIISAFDEGIKAFYDEEDRKNGYIETKDRKEVPVRQPLMGIAIAVVTNQKRKLTQVGQVSQIAAELKHFVKSMGGSRFMVDRRTG